MFKGPRLLLVHGSVVNGEVTWNAQRPLAERFQLVVPNRRGFPPGPDADRVDFEDEAAWLEGFLEPETHLVGHSYGGVISLLTAARRPELVRSLTVIEPPAFGLARGHRAVEEFIERSGAITTGDPEAYLRAFLALVGSPQPAEMNAARLQGARMLMIERPPWEAEIPLDRLAGMPTLVLSGGHSAAFDAVCDVLVERLDAERAVLPGAGHSPQRLGEPFNTLLTAFVMKQTTG
ncbi:MAG: alpha/beta fold hydrolase [Gaiellaceae bacterium]